MIGRLNICCAIKPISTFWKDFYPNFENSHSYREGLESESNKNHAEDKFNRVDLLVKTGEGQHIIVEVQCSSQWDYLSRILYGTSKVVCEHCEKGFLLRKISKVISVSIVFFNLGEGKDYLYHGATIFKGLH